MPVICVYKQIDEVAIRTVEEINANVEIAEITGDTQHIVPEYMEKRNESAQNEEKKEVKRQSRSDVDRSGNIEMIKKMDKNIIQEVKKEYPHLEKKGKTVAQRKSASRSDQNEEKKNWREKKTNNGRDNQEAPKMRRKKMWRGKKANKG